MEITIKDENATATRSMAQRLIKANADFSPALSYSVVGLLHVATITVMGSYEAKKRAVK